MNQTCAALNEPHQECPLVRLCAPHPVPKSVRTYFIDPSAFDGQPKPHNARHLKVSQTTNFTKTLQLYNNYFILDFA